MLLQTLNATNNPLDRLQNVLTNQKIPLNLDAIEAQVRNLFGAVLNWAVSALPVILQNYITFIIILVVAFFMLIDGAKIWQLVMKLVPDRHRSRVAIAIQRNFVGWLSR